MAQDRGISGGAFWHLITAHVSPSQSQSPYSQCQSPLARTAEDASAGPPALPPWDPCYTPDVTPGPYCQTISRCPGALRQPSGYCNPTGKRTQARPAALPCLPLMRPAPAAAGGAPDCLSESLPPRVPWQEGSALFLGARSRASGHRSFESGDTPNGSPPFLEHAQYSGLRMMSGRALSEETVML